MNNGKQVHELVLGLEQGKLVIVDEGADLGSVQPVLRITTHLSARYVRIKIAPSSGHGVPALVHVLNQGTNALISAGDAEDEFLRTVAQVYYPGERQEN